MVQPQSNSFEEQLQRSADELNFKPSNKVWQGVENSLNNNSTLGAGTSVAKSLLGNWFLNILVPAVVLVGGGSVFYANYTSDSNSAKDVNNSVEVTSVSANSNTIQNSKETVAATSENNSNSKETVVVSTMPAKSISENQNNANAVNYSLGYVNNVQSNQNNSVIGLLNALTKKNSTEQKDENSTNTNNIVFTNSDIEKISKKESEKNAKADYQERNTKSVDFTE